MTKHNFLSLKSYADGGWAKNPLVAFPEYYSLKNAVEIDFTSFIESNSDWLEDPTSRNIFKSGHLPYNTILFTYTPNAIIEEKFSNEEIVCLLTKRTYNNLPVYTFHFFIFLKDNVFKDLPMYIGYLRVDKKEMKVEYNFVRDHLEVVKKEMDEEEMQEHFEYEQTLVKYYIQIYLHVMNYINECHVLNIDSDNLEFKDNLVIEKTGDEVRRIQIKPGINIQRYHLKNKRTSPRLHDVRGYYRRSKYGKITWVSPSKRGDPNKGVITTIVEPVICKTPINPRLLSFALIRK